MINRLLLIIVFLFCLNGCAQLNEKHTVEEDLAGQQMLLIVSLGDEFTFRKSGFTEFEAKRQKIDVSDWEVSSHVEKELHKTLNEHYRIKYIHHSRRSEFIEFQPYVFTNFFKINEQAEFIKQFAIDEDAELILMVLPAIYQGADLYHPERGFGVHLSNVLGKKRGRYFFGVKIILYNGSTGNEYAWEQSLNDEAVEYWYEPNESTTYKEISEWKARVLEDTTRVALETLIKMKIIK